MFFLLSTNSMIRGFFQKSNLKLIGSIFILIARWFLPTSAFGMECLSTIRHRIILFSVLAAFFWASGPIHVTFVLLITLELFLISDSGLIFLRDQGFSNFGISKSYQEIMATFTSPVIERFLEGFLLDTSATKHRLDQRIIYWLSFTSRYYPSNVSNGNKQIFKETFAIEGIYSSIKNRLTQPILEKAIDYQSYFYYLKKGYILEKQCKLS
jgi:hypothetical protein